MVDLLVIWTRWPIYPKAFLEVALLCPGVDYCYFEMAVTELTPGAIIMLTPADVLPILYDVLLNVARDLAGVT